MYHHTLAYGYIVSHIHSITSRGNEGRVDRHYRLKGRPTR